MSLIRQSSERITSPTRPSICDTDPDILLLVDGDRSAAADGSAVSDLIATGSATAAEKNFTHRRSTSWEWPTMDRNGSPTGRRALRFNGSAQIANYAGTSGFVTHAQPFTIFATLSVDAFNYATSSLCRVFSGGVTSGTAVALRPSNTPGRFLISTGTTSVGIDTTMVAGGWGVIGISLDGGASKAILPNGVIVPLALINVPLDGIRIGGNITNAPDGSAFLGALGDLRIYGSAIDDDKLSSVHTYLRRKFIIT